MKRNFSAVTETTLRALGRDFDLHNDFSFDGLCFTPTTRKAEIAFKCRTSQSITLVITFEAVSVFRIFGLKMDMPFDEDECLDCLGYLHPDDLDVMDGFLPEDASAEDYHMIFIFRGGLVLKLFAEEARVKTHTSPLA